MGHQLNNLITEFQSLDSKDSFEAFKRRKEQSPKLALSVELGSHKKKICKTFLIFDSKDLSEYFNYPLSQHDREQELLSKND